MLRQSLGKEGETGSSPFKVGQDETSRRGVLVAAVAVTGMTVFGDQLRGFAEARNMSHDPSAMLFERPGSDVVVMTLPGNRVDGKAMARLLAAGPFGHVNVVGVDYADDNVDPLKLAMLIQGCYERLRSRAVKSLRTSFYLNSISGKVAIPVFEMLRASGWRTDLIIFDSSPFDRNDIRGSLNGVAAQTRLDKAGHSRWLNRVMQTFVDLGTPAVQDEKDAAVPFGLAWVSRQALVNCDTITQSSQATALDLVPPVGSMFGFVRRMVYIQTAGADPLVVTETALPKYRRVFGDGIELFTDQDRATRDPRGEIIGGSHGDGHLKWTGLSEVFGSSFPANT